VNALDTIPLSTLALARGAHDDASQIRSHNLND
jgi:hypothetical protein